MEFFLVPPISGRRGANYRTISRVARRTWSCVFTNEESGCCHSIYDTCHPPWAISLRWQVRLLQQSHKGEAPLIHFLKISYFVNRTLVCTMFHHACTRGETLIVNCRDPLVVTDVLERLCCCTLKLSLVSNCCALSDSSYLP